MKDNFCKKYNLKHLKSRKAGFEQNISSNEIVEEKMLRMTLNLLMSLPAYALKNKDREIFYNHAFLELDKSIRRYSIEEYTQTNNNKDQKTPTINEIYKSPSLWKIWHLTIKTLSKTKKGVILFRITTFSFFVSIFFRITDEALIKLFHNNLLIALIYIFSVLVFAMSFLMFGIELNIQRTNVKSTFNALDKIINKINEYIKTLHRKDFHGFSDEKIFSKTILISKNIIEDDISGLGYYSNKLNLYHILFALFISFLVIYMSGDSFVVGIKLISGKLSFGDFEFFNKLNREKFVAFILFPIGLALSKDMVASGSQRRNQLLRQSLVSLKDYLEDDQIKKKSSVILRRLSSRIDSISTFSEAKISELSISQLEELNKAIIDLSSSVDLDNWLQNNL